MGAADSSSYHKHLGKFVFTLAANVGQSGDLSGVEATSGDITFATADKELEQLTLDKLAVRQKDIPAPPYADLVNRQAHAEGFNRRFGSGTKGTATRDRVVAKRVEIAR
jgi:hypothetical protein